MTRYAHRRIREPVPRRLPGAGGRRGDRDRPDGHRSHPRAPRRALSAQRARTRSPRSTRPSTTGSPATPWCTALALRDGQARWYRNRWVRTPAVCAALGEPAPTGLQSARRNAVRRAQHQRAEPRRTHAGAGRGRRRQLRADRRTGHRRRPATSTGPWPAATPRTRTATRAPASCTRCPIPSRAGAPCSTR